MSENNVCFISNYSKTWLFDGIAQLLQSSGYGIFWITVNERIYEELAKRYQPSTILHIDKSYSEKPSEKIGEFKLNELIYGDRALSHIPDLGRLDPDLCAALFGQSQIQRLHYQHSWEASEVEVLVWPDMCSSSPK